MNYIFLVLIIFFISFGFTNSSPVSAASEPSFPACANPGGTQKANFSVGIHGIVGRSETFSGADAVYTLSDNTLVQCFCATNGAGIQTNWWKIEGMSDAEIKVFQVQGWNYVPNGALWGLDQAPYLAKNNDYSCKSSTLGASSSNSGSGSVIGASSNAVGSVLGLASTGNLRNILSLFLIGLIGLFSSFLFRVIANKQ